MHTNPTKTIDEALHNFSGDWVDVNRKYLTGMEHLLSMRDVEVDNSVKTEVYREDKIRLFHYEPLAKQTCKVPVLICYALVNRYYMMDLQSDRSLIGNLLRGGLDIYIIDWGYPSKMDRFLTMEDYIQGYLNSCVDYVRADTGHEQINLLGVCQGGTFSTIYTALNADKIKNLVCMVSPIDFRSSDGMLNIWAQDLDVDSLVDTYGVIPGWFMNYGFLMLKPFQLIIDKYVSMLDIMHNREALSNFVRMEKWIFDSPGQAGETIRKFIKDLYQGNKLIKGELEIGGERVSLKDVTCPLLNIYGTKDHLVPPECSRPLADLVGSTDTESMELPIGHIGMYVSSKSQKVLAPRIIEWCTEHSADAPALKKGKRAAPRKAKKTAGRRAKSGNTKPRPRPRRSARK
jgi:polyhydroxyalkanoate synthase